MQSAAFELLHPKVQQVVLDLGWSCFYPIQEDAVRCFVEHSSDLILAAPTSGGKTEAIVLPVLSDLVATRPTKVRSVRVLYISPLKALINDQFGRLTKLCKPLGIAVHRWHGDVDMEAKRRLRERPSGILFITPESLESCFINYPHEILKMFQALDYVVVDELHALLETERGMHVRSLLARLMAAIERRPRCFGLSATLGDPLAARSFLNQDHPDSVRVISDRSTARPIAVEVVSIRDDSPAEPNPGPSTTDKHNGKCGTLAIIAKDLRIVFSDGSYLVFGNSRRTVEELGDHFLGDCELPVAGEPVVALHHGSLSARLRRRTEAMLKSGTPTRALCTSSLELGIDIGAVEAVAQIDPPWSVAAMVQRLGRSGRKPGSTSNLLLYLRIGSVDTDASLVDLLYPSLLQATAMVKLLLGGWLEPIRSDRMHLSTLVHQILSILKENGGRVALALYQSLCCQGPFRRVAPADFKLLLQRLYANDLIKQDAEGILFLGMAGERVTSAPGFYAAFSTPVELTVRWGAKELGRLPASATLKEGECLLLNGRRWLVDSIDWKAKCIWVSPAAMKKAPLFIGGVGETQDRIFQEMRQVLLGAEEPDWLDPNSLALLRSARDTAHNIGLTRGDVIDREDGLQWFPWVGTRSMRTLQLWAKEVGLNCSKDCLSLTFNDVSRQDFERHLAALAAHDIDAVKLAKLMTNKQAERFDNYVDERLLDKANAEYRLDLAGAREAARRTLNQLRQNQGTA
jgi:ATP-dependent helicase Lhr and Lhr-like helicase